MVTAACCTHWPLPASSKLHLVQFIFRLHSQLAANMIMKKRSSLKQSESRERTHQFSQQIPHSSNALVENVHTGARSKNRNKSNIQRVDSVLRPRELALGRDLLSAHREGLWVSSEVMASARVRGWQGAPLRCQKLPDNDGAYQD